MWFYKKWQKTELIFCPKMKREKIETIREYNFISEVYKYKTILQFKSETNKR